MDRACQGDVFFLQIVRHFPENGGAVTFCLQVFKARNCPFCPAIRCFRICRTFHTRWMKPFPSSVEPSLPMTQKDSLMQVCGFIDWSSYESFFTYSQQSSCKCLRTPNGFLCLKRG